MRVRPARPGDLPAVSRLAAELVRLHHRLDPLRFMLIEPAEAGYQWFFSRELKRKAAIILVAEDDPPPPAKPAKKPANKTARGARPALLGYAYATLERRNWNDLLDACGKLNDIYVHPAARRRGVARRLITATLAALRARGAPRVVLLTAWQNPDAHALFESTGFRRTMLEMTAELGGEPERNALTDPAS
jgi:ribosomal protein S18 acetylase RimI-like enzyme